MAEVKVKPLVFKRSGKQRLGKGFSLGELKEVELSLKHALKLGVPVDPRRRTIHEENIKALKEFLAPLAKASGAKAEKADRPAAERKEKEKAKSVKRKR